MRSGKEVGRVSRGVSTRFEEFKRLCEGNYVRLEMGRRSAVEECGERTPTSCLFSGVWALQEPFRVHCVRFKTLLQVMRSSAAPWRDGGHFRKPL